MSAAILVANALGKRFEDDWLFRGVEFELSQGNSLVIRGHNGSGKSTLLKILAKLLRPSEGEVLIPSARIGYAALDGALYAGLTVAEHLELAGELRFVNPKVDYWLGKIGLYEARDKLCSKLSTGMRGRVKLALAMQHEPDLLLLDEPGAGLDEAGRELVKIFCAEQLARGALILATNDSGESKLAQAELCL